MFESVVGISSLGSKRVGLGSSKDDRENKIGQEFEVQELITFKPASPFGSLTTIVIFERKYWFKFYKLSDVF